MKHWQAPCVLASIVLLGNLQISGAQDEEPKSDTEDFSQPRSGQNALAMVSKLLSKLEKKVQEEGQKEADTYEKHRRFCTISETETREAINLGKRHKSTAQAFADELKYEIQSVDAQIDEMVSDLSPLQADLEAAERRRKQEADNFKAAEKELEETVRVVSDALVIIERQVQKSHIVSIATSLAQIDVNKLEKLTRTFSTMIDASSILGESKQELLSLMQANDDQKEQNDMGEAGRQAEKFMNGDDDAANIPNPNAENGGGRSRRIMDLLEDLKEKAESELLAIREEEIKKDNNHKLAWMARKNQVQEAEKELKTVQAERNKLSEQKSIAEGDLNEIKSLLTKDEEFLDSLIFDCAQWNKEHNNYVKDMTLELKAVGDAREHIYKAMHNTELLQIQTAGSEDAASDAASTSFVQVERHRNRGINRAKAQAVGVVKQLSIQFHSAALAQLASRMKAIMRYSENAPSADGTDPFATVKDLIKSMIEKFDAELKAQITEKTFCDDETAKTKEKNETLSSEISEMTAVEERTIARVLTLSKEKKEVMAELAHETKHMAEETAIWEEEHKNYLQVKTDLEEALRGVREAITALRKFYGKSGKALLQEAKRTLAGGSAPKTTTHNAGEQIIIMLEVLADDFAERQTKEAARYESIKAPYEKEMESFQVSQVSKTETVKFLDTQLVRAKRELSDLQETLSNSEEDHEAVLRYSKELKERCTEKPDTYAAMRARRKAEVGGLTKALEILEGASLMQKGRKLRLRVP